MRSHDITATVKPNTTIYDRDSLESVIGDVEIIGSPRSIDYECGCTLVQSDRMVTPSRCPGCNEPLGGGG